MGVSRKSRTNTHIHTYPHTHTRRGFEGRHQHHGVVKSSLCFSCFSTTFTPPRSFLCSSHQHAGETHTSVYPKGTTAHQAPLSVQFFRQDYSRERRQSQGQRQCWDPGPTTATAAEPVASAGSSNRGGAEDVGLAATAAPTATASGRQRWRDPRCWSLRPKLRPQLQAPRSQQQH